MNARNHIIFWSAAFAGFLLFVFVFKDILLPFVLGITVAYLLNPLTTYLGRTGLKRGPAALLILAVFFLIIVLGLVILIPVLYRELAELSKDLPTYIDRIQAALQPLEEKFAGIIGQSPPDLKTFIGSNAGTALNTARQIMSGLVSGGQAAAGFISVTVLTPLVAFFMMKEWPAIMRWCEGLIPPDKKNIVMGLLQDIDKKLAGFVRGQLSVAFILGIGYALALSIAGLKYGFLIGITAGILSIIPMLGSSVGFLVSVLVAWFQTGEWMFVAIVAGIFLAGQFIEGNFLSPRLLGKTVGMHPLWVFFALLAGGSLFGIVGMLLAVPVAAAIGVLSAFVIEQYKNSPYYKSPQKKTKSKKETKKER